MDPEVCGEEDPVWKGQSIGVYRRGAGTTGPPLLQKALSMDAIGRPSEGLQSELAKLRLFMCNAEDILALAQEKIGRTESLEAEIKSLKTRMTTSSPGLEGGHCLKSPDTVSVASDSQSSHIRAPCSCGSPTFCSREHERLNAACDSPTHGSSPLVRIQKLEKQNQDLRARIEFLEKQNSQQKSLLSKYEEVGPSSRSNSKNQSCIPTSEQYRDARVQVGEVTCSSDHEFSGLQEIFEGREEGHHAHTEREFNHQRNGEDSTCQSVAKTEKEQMQDNSSYNTDREKELLEIERRIRNYTDSRFRDIEKSTRERDESINMRNRVALKRCQFMRDAEPKGTGLKLIHGTQKARTAQVVLVMRGDSYALGACVVAARAKALGTRADLVCMVTSDVTMKARDCLSQVFDVVYEVPYLQYTCEKMTTRKQQNYYDSWIGQSFTKWNALALNSYDKVLLVDADLLPVCNLDELFDLKAPAATFSSPWANSFKEDGYMDPYVGLKHGGEVDGEMIQEAIRESMAHSAGGKGSYVALGSLVLLEPSLDAFFALKAFILSRQPFGVPGLHSGFDEQSLVLFYNTHYPHRPWTHIGQAWNSLAWHEHWLGGAEPKAYHYFNGKPWSVSPAKYPDLKIWYSAAADMLKDYKGLKPLFSMCLESESFMADFHDLNAKDDYKMKVEAPPRSPKPVPTNVKESLDESDIPWRPLETRPSWADIQDEVSGSVQESVDVRSTNGSCGPRDRGVTSSLAPYENVSSDYRKRNTPVRGSQPYGAQNSRWALDRSSERWTKPQGTRASINPPPRNVPKPDFHGNHWQRAPDSVSRNHNSDRWRDSGASRRRDDGSDYRSRKMHASDRSGRW